MKRILYICCLISFTAKAQTSKSDAKDLSQLKKHITYLSDDKLEGRRTGTRGEQLAAAYIIKQFKKTGINPSSAYPDYLQPFEVKDGKKIIFADVTLNGKLLTLQTDFFPMSWSASSTLKNTSNVFWYDVAEMLSSNANNPHFDFMPAIYEAVKKQAQASAILLYNSSSIADQLLFDKNDKAIPLNMPVLFIKENARALAMKNNTSTELSCNIQIENAIRRGHNVIGYIDNKAMHTVVLGAHYDHLGYGEDHNSLYTGTTPMIHNGADDNASGTAALLLLAKRLKTTSLTNNNYLLVAFSGEELGLYGSKYFTEHSPINISDINYMINMDMLGRLNDSTHGLTIGGYGTSPAWSENISSSDAYFKIKTDSSGAGPSDHTSFYRKDLPVLFFFTGTHHDYHKPSDDADKINYTGEIKVINYIYNIIEKTNNKGKIAFTKTRESAAGKSSFKVSMGIMPDYTFSGNGVLVDGVSDGRAAQKAGILQGDVIHKLGDHEVQDVQTYMQALNKFEKGQTTNVYIKRGDKELVFVITF